MKIAALLPHFSGLAGHEIIYHETFKKILEEENSTYEVFSQKNPDLPPHWICHFSKKSSFLSRFTDFLRLFRKKKEVYFFESCTGIELLAYILAALLNTQLSSHWLLYRHDLCHQGKKALITLFFLKLFSFIKKKKFVLISDSQLIIDYFASKKLKCIHLPNFHAQDINVCVSMPMSTPFICFWPGSPRKDKGAEEITHLLQNHTDQDFKIVLADSFATPNSKLTIIKIPSLLSREEYLSYLFNCHFVFLPYDPIVYRSRTSGIFVEAVIAGKWPLVKDGTWLADQLRQFHCEELIINWKNPHFFAHLKILANNMEINKKLLVMKEALIQESKKERIKNIINNL